jgi:hypothetical protein
MRLTFLRTSALVFVSLMLMAASCGDDPITPSPSLKDPTNFKATVISETRVDLSWTGVSEATGYSLERKPDGGNYAEIESLSKTESYSDTTVEAGKTYSYRVFSLRNSEKSKGVESDKVTPPPPGQVFNLTELEPIWFSKQPRNGNPSSEATAPDAVSESGTSLIFTGNAEALYSVAGLCTKFSASVSGSGKVFADETLLWSGTGSTGDLSVYGKQQLSLVSTGNTTWANVVVTCSRKPDAPNSAYVGGKWGSKFTWGTSSTNRLVATHAANLPDGRIISWSAWDSLTFGIIAGERHDYSEGFVWNPKAGTGPTSFTEADNDGGGTLNQNRGHDMFCAGLAMAPDGRVIGVGGGTEDSLKKVSFFNFRSSEWEEGPLMARDRWYATAVALPDGRTFATLGDDSRDTAEILNASRSSWQGLGGENAFDDIKPTRTDINIGTSFQTQEEWEFGEVDEWYPYLHVAPDSSLFQSGPIPRFKKINTSNAAITDITTSVPNAQMRTWGNSVMFDEGKILVTGGSVVRGFDATQSGMVIELNSSGGVSAQAIPEMRFKRSFQNSVVLPTGDVLIIGGNTTGKQMVDGSNSLIADPNAPFATYAPNPDGCPVGDPVCTDARNAKKRWPSDKPTETVYTPEVYSPSKNTWRDMNDMSTPRNYHSVALLLEDGRVLAAGGGLCGRICASNHPDGEIYEPAYLFNPDGSLANRPVVQNVPTSIGTGQQFTVTMGSLGDGSAISKFTLIKLSAVTHGINTDLRYFEFSENKDEAEGRTHFEQLSATSYKLTTTSNKNVLTPGYYFLFAINDNGVPSVAKVVQTF